MSLANESSFLAKLAALFNAEGDVATADALVARTRITCTRFISDESRSRILALERKGVRLDNQGLHEEAEGLFAGALLLIESALGPDHADVIDHLNDLARCRFNDGNYAAALPQYQRLLRLVEREYGTDDMLAKITRQNIENCQQGLRTRNGVRHLQAQMTIVLRQASAG